MKITFPLALIISVVLISGCHKDCPVEPVPDCWNPEVANELLEPNSNTCLTNNLWSFTQIYLEGSTWHGAVESPVFNTFPHKLVFDEQGFYYVVYHGDTVQSGRFLTYDFPYPNEPGTPGQTVEFAPDCIERDTFLVGFYAMQCNTLADTTGLLTLNGTYYRYGGYGNRRLVIYGFTN